MDRGIVKVILIVVVLFLLGAFFTQSDRSEKSTNYENEEAEFLDDNEYFRNAKITDVLLFDYANLYYQDRSYDKDQQFLTLNYLETCERPGDAYNISAYDHNNKKLKLSVVIDQSRYVESDDLYYTNYHLQINVSNTSNSLKLKISRDKAEYVITCPIET